MPVDDLPSLSLLSLISVLDVVRNDVDRRSFFGGDQVGQNGSNDGCHSAVRGRAQANVSKLVSDWMTRAAGLTTKR